MGILYKAVCGALPLKQAVVAACLWLFSASWSYDLNLLLRDGDYPNTWLPNLFASSVLYVCAGLLWNLDWRKGRGVIFAFMAEDWFAPPERRALRRILWFALPFILLVAAMILPFLLRNVP